MATIKLLGNTADLSTANNCNNATMVRVVNTGAAEVIVSVANTVSPVNGGGPSGSVVIEAGATDIIVKEPTDTIVATAAVKATPVARY
jgi:hypothetical protein